MFFLCKSDSRVDKRRNKWGRIVNASARQLRSRLRVSHSQLASDQVASSPKAVMDISSTATMPEDVCWNIGVLFKLFTVPYEVDA